MNFHCHILDTKIPFLQRMIELTGRDPMLCPGCKKGRLVLLQFGRTEDEALRNHPADDFSAGPACGAGDRKRKNLIRLGVDSDHAYAWSRTRMGVH